MNSFNLHKLAYKDFFSEATGNEPYPYQEAFHQRELSSFSTLTAPTGAGKTETFTCDWLYGRVCSIKDTPTKLVITSPLKTLVEQTYERVSAIVENLNLENRISVYLLMGGKVENEWEGDLSREIILIATQDQILSRQLNRGYCLNKTKWPIHFAALNNDCRIVVDETQLQGVGYKTAFYLQRFRDKFGCYGKTQLILCSATLDTSFIDRVKAEQKKLNENKTEIKVVSCSLGDDDFNHSQLAKRLKKSKALFKAKTVWLGESNSQFINSLKEEILEHHVADSLTLVILNRVESVQKLYQSLQGCLDERATQVSSETSDDAPSLELKLLHGTFRKGDRSKLVEDLINFKGIIIATQCVEAGIDLDAKLLFTQLCPWSSFVQRCGRAGRKGLQDEVKIFWINHSSNNKYHASPYESDELQKSRSLIKRLKDASIENLLAQPLPPQITNCDNLSAKVLKQLFHTQLEDSDRDPDFGEYIREAINNNVYIAWRNFSGAPSPNWQIQEIEVCSVPIGKIRKFSATGWQYNPYNASEETWPPISTDTVSAGSTILFPCSVGGYSAKLGFTGNVEDIPTELEITLPQVNDKSDRSSFNSCQVTLKQHSLDVAKEMEQLAERLKPVLPAGFKEYLVEIAQWHDVGKAHEIFQETIGGNRDFLLAKSPQVSRRRHRRRGFRHELASAIAALIEGKHFIFAYLVCCHHGKVRTKLLKDVHLDKYSDFLNLEYYGVREGDVLPVMDLGSPINRINSLTLSYQRNDTNLHPDIWWKRECQVLIDDPNLGIFRLAYLETLIRCADAIASSKY